MEPETHTMEKPEVHHGHNVKFARNLSGKSQDELAELLSSTQKAIYKLEQQKVIEESTLIQIANVLHFPIDFFKEAQPDNILAKYTFENITVTNTVGDDSPDNQNYTNLANVDINNEYHYSIDPKYAKLCDRLIGYISNDLKKEKASNKKLETELARLQNELNKLKSGNN